MKNKTALVMYFFAMMFMMYGIWIFTDVFKEVKGLIADGMIDLDKSIFMVANYFVITQGVGFMLFFTLVLFALGVIIQNTGEVEEVKVEEKLEEVKEEKKQVEAKAEKKEEVKVRKKQVKKE